MLTERNNFARTRDAQITNIENTAVLQVTIYV